MVAVYRSPFLAGIVVVVAGTALVVLPDPVSGLIVRQIIQIGNPSHPDIEIRVNEYAQKIRVILERVIRTPSDDNTRSLLCKLLHGVKLCQEYLLIQWHIVHDIRCVTEGIGIHYQRIQKTAGRFLILIFKNFLGESAVLGGLVEKLLVVKRDLQIFCKQFADQMSAASKFTSDCNDGLHNKSSFLHRAVARNFLSSL